MFVLVSLYPGFRVKISNAGLKMANFFFFNQLHFFVLNVVRSNKLHQYL